MQMEWKLNMTNQDLHCTSREPEGQLIELLYFRISRYPPQPACFDTAVTFADKCHKRILILVQNFNLQTMNTHEHE
jgi:hypothetical protein